METINVPLALLYDTDLKHSAKLLYVRLSTLGNPGEVIKCSNDTLGDPIDIFAHETVARLLKDLSDAGWIERYGTGKSRALIYHTEKDIMRRKLL